MRSTNWNTDGVQGSPRSGCQGLTLSRPPLLPRPPLLSRSLVATLPLPLVATLVRPLVATLPLPLVATLVRPLVGPFPLPLVATLVRTPVAVVVVAVDIAVKVVVAVKPVEVEAPALVPKIPRAPVIQRYRADVGLGGTRRQPQSGQPQTTGRQHRRCYSYEGFAHALVIG